MFRPFISIPLAEMGCYVLAGQEYKLQHKRIELRFRIRRGDYDRNEAKRIIALALQELDYGNIHFAITSYDQLDARQSKSFDFFTARGEM